MAFNSNIPFFLPVSAATTTLGANDGQVGMKITYEGEDYVLAYNGCTAQALPGNIVALSASTNYSFVLTSVTNAGAAFGAVKHATIAASNYGWVLVRGYADLINGMAGTAPANGDIIELAADGKFAKANTILATGSAGLPFGIVQSAGASGGTGASKSYCFIKTLG